VHISDFDNIPPLGDRYVDEQEGEESLEQEAVDEEDVEEKGGKYRFNGKHIYVIWSKSKIESKEEFHEKLLTIPPPGVRLFGGRELHLVKSCLRYSRRGSTSILSGFKPAPM